MTPPRTVESSQPAPSLLAGLRTLLGRHAPFAQMAPEHVELLLQAAELVYFAPGERLLGPDEPTPGHCFIIKSGRVRGERPLPTGEAAAAWELTVGEVFPIGALLTRRPVTSVYRALGDVFCLRVPDTVFHQATQQSPVFQDFCNRRLAALLDLSRQQLQAAYVADAASQQGMETALERLVRRAPVSCAADTPVVQVLQTMQRERVGSMVVVDAEHRPLGMFTPTDVIGRVVLAGRPLATPIAEVMSAPPVVLPRDAPAGEAALVMAERGIQHVVLVNRDEPAATAGRVVGVISERDLFSLQRLSLRQTSLAVRGAQTPAELHRVADDIRTLSRGLVAQGVAAAQLTQFISRLNDQLTARLLELLMPANGFGDLGWCWLALGSEGRCEQTISTDQDNGLIFRSTDDRGPEPDRERLLRFAERVNGELDACGYPRCKGGIMAGNPDWCLTQAEWQDRFAGWIDRGDPEALLAANIFFDFRPLAGDPGMAVALRTDVTERARRSPRFLKQMTDNALLNRPPLNWLGEIVVEREGGSTGIDLKMQGAAPFVDGARILALAAGVEATGTVERLRQAGEKLSIPRPETAAWSDAFLFVQMLRLRVQHQRKPAAGGQPERPNWLDPTGLSEVDQRILKEAFRQARKLQQRLAADYPG